jgi:hypothetical protein
MKPHTLLPLQARSLHCSRHFFYQLKARSNSSKVFPSHLFAKERIVLACLREGGREGVCSGVCVRRLWRIGSAAAEEEEAAFEVGKKCGSSMHWQDP